MLVNSKKMLKKALKNKKAILHFNINNLEWTKIVLEKCNELKTPIILGVSESAIEYMGGYNVVNFMVRSLVYDLKIDIPVCLHLDHGSSFLSCKKAIDAGFTSVMIDASKYDLNTNIKITKQVVNYARKHNVSVETEIGSLSENNFASINDAVKLVKQTKVDSLAPAVGNAHGITKEINLNYSLIKEISSETKIPLVLHGATGLSDEQIKMAIENGISKVNINTEFQIVWSNALKTYLNENKNIYDPRKIIYSGSEAIKEKIEEKIKILNN